MECGSSSSRGAKSDEVKHKHPPLVVPKPHVVYSTDPINKLVEQLFYSTRSSEGAGAAPSSSSSKTATSTRAVKLVGFDIEVRRCKLTSA